MGFGKNWVRAAITKWVDGFLFPAGNNLKWVDGFQNLRNTHRGMADGHTIQTSLMPGSGSLMANLTKPMKFLA